MPKSGNQWLGLLTVGGLAALAAGVANNLTNQEGGFVGFGATVAGGAIGAGLGVLVMGGRGIVFK